MSLINDALKRAQRTQAGALPAQPVVPPLQPAIVPAVHSKSAPVFLSTAALAILGFALWLQPWGWRHADRIVQTTSVSEPVVAIHLAAASHPVRVPLKEFSPMAASPAVVATDAVASASAGAKLIAIQETSSSALSQKMSTAKSAPESGLATPIMESKPAPVAAPNPGFNVYIVRAGDTLTRIAKRQGTTLKALRDSNDLKADRIAIGQKIRVPILPSPRVTGAA